MGDYLKPEDFASFADIDAAKAAEMIDDAESMAVLSAPCLANIDDLSDVLVKAVRAILRRAILRWHEVGAGGTTTTTRGPFGETVDTSSTASKNLFWPSEINNLQEVCRQATGGASGGKAFTVDMVPKRGLSEHGYLCSLRLGGIRCTCGADIADHPIYEG